MSWLAKIKGVFTPKPPTDEFKTVTLPNGRVAALDAQGNFLRFK